MTPRSSVLSVALAVVLGLGGCASSPLGAGGPPSVAVRGGGDAVELQPWTWCWTSGCADGAPPQDPVDLGRSEELVLSFPEGGWEFEAAFSPAGQPCGRVQNAPVEQVAEGEYRVVPAGPAGTYNVDLFGRGPQGDVVVTVQWTTVTDGPMPIPAASLAVLADNDGTVDSYGVDLLLDDLAATPQQAKATIDVTSAEGRSLMVDAAQLQGDCQEDGWVLFNGTIEQGRQAAALGTAPFTYDVDLVLDGQRYAATATWPDDVLEDSGSAVALVFDPPLPTLASGR